MLNYIKSEIYLNIKSKSNYIFLFGGIGFAIFLNVALGIYSNTQIDFPYGNTKYSFSSFYTFMGVVMLICLTLVSIISGLDFKNHTLKNTIAYGISKQKIYLCKFLVEVCIGCISLVLIGSVYAISGYIMLEDSGIFYLNELIRAIIASVPLLIASVSAAHCFYFIYENETTASVVWAVVMVVIPQLVDIAGRRIDILNKIGRLMPWNMLNSNYYDSTKNALIMHWSSKSGFIQCFLVGIVGTIIFYIIGSILFEKREIK